MPIPPLKKRLAETLLTKFCQTKIPAEFETEIKLSYRFRGLSATLIEGRLAMLKKGEWHEMAIAQFRYAEKNGKWSLYCADRNDKWHLYTECEASKDLNTLLEEVDEDPTGIFFG